MDSPAPGTAESQLTPGVPPETFDLPIASKTFSRSEQLRRLLLYLRGVSGSDDPCVWSEMAIGASVFGRPDFNPKLDTIVRVEMRRLRQKLDEFYASEGAGLPFRLRFERNSYRPCLYPNTPLAAVPGPAETEVIPAEAAPVAPADRFGMGFAYGAGLSALLVLTAGLIWWLVPAASTGASSREVAKSPLWFGFSHRNVVVAVGSPLFFRSGDGFERDFRMNLPADLFAADRFLLRLPASPQWSYWAAFDDIGAAVKLDRFLRDLNSTATIVSARQLSIGGLAGQRTILVGQPRAMPLLIDLLRDQNFRTPPHIAGEYFSGFVNMNPAPGEPRSLAYGAGSQSQTYGMMESDESNPDYALVTSIRLADGGEVLSVFGDRSPTEGYLIGKLTEPVFVSQLARRVFAGGNAAYESAQIVLRVDYNRGAPTGLVYLAHRVRFPGGKSPGR